MPLSVGTVMPSLEGATEWLNGETGSDDLHGYPTLVQFWAISCPICKMNLPAIESWKQTYGPIGLRLVAVHMPRSESDTNIEAVKQAVLECGITEPCAIDNQHAIGDRFQTGGFWPYYFLFDREGKLRRHAAGPVGLRLVENALKHLLGQESGSRPL